MTILNGLTRKKFNEPHWNPLEISDLFAWWTADEGLTTSTVEDNEVVSSWADQKNGYILEQPSPGVRPKVIEGSHGHKSLLYDANYVLRSTLLLVDWRFLHNASGEGYTLVVFKRNTEATAFHLCGTSDNASLSIGITLTLDNRDTGVVDGVRFATTWNGNPGSFINSSNRDLSQWATAGFHFDGSRTQSWIRGVSLAQGGAITPSAIGPSQVFAVGVGSGGASWYRGEVAEIVVVKGNLSVAEHNSWLEYINKKYGIEYTPIS